MNAPLRKVANETADSGAGQASALELAGVSHDFGGAPVIDNLSLTVARGEVVGLVGHSGSGKSTLLRLIAGLERPRRGIVRIGGKEMTGPSAQVPPERRGVGMVFQDYALFPHLTLQGNVLFGIAGRNRSRAEAQTALDRVGMADRADDYPHKLSGGEQQRVALVRALMPGPGILLLDEPFSSLDRRNRDTIRDETAQILRESGTTVVVVTHEPEDAMRMTDRIVLLERGRIVQDGTANRLYRQPASLAVARFFSEFNEIPATGNGGFVDTPLGRFAMPAGRPDGDVLVCIRPHDVRVDEDAFGSALRGSVLKHTYIGDEQMFTVRVAGLTAPLQVRAPVHVRARVGEPIAFHVIAEDALVFPAEGERAA